MIIVAPPKGVRKPKLRPSSAEISIEKLNTVTPRAIIVTPKLGIFFQATSKRKSPEKSWYLVASCKDSRLASKALLCELIASTKIPVKMSKSPRLEGLNKFK